ncbi:MAG TPA: heparinase II/III family protein [Parabacteroides johnsonii]|uniref:heparinase II/III domain-containing protein n=1 Tax=Parabacteroides johnsonii TaxID=387661 RepID=UPI00101B6737|nr:heparinase II/III family protein [Parabacteroides johnsonii]UEA90225.1 heparinase II/III family protein [Parabacteroides johnsonii]UWP42387.1 heparinase II/III family protein [Parabacteroides johnsonii DSM 18315]HJG98443.1 heparinase II/III family protein [Parabacteroides johnsonii]
MRLINLIGLFFLLFSFVVTGRDLSVRQSGKDLLQHPRLLFSKQEEQRIRDLFGTEPLLDSLYVGLMKEAERLLLVPPQEDPRREIKNTKDILPISREQVYRMVNLALAYRLSGDRRFAEKAEKELVHVCNFPDWDPIHYLDVAEMTTAVAIGYDWLYDVLAPSTRQLVVHSIKTKALDLVVEEYNTGNADSWAKRETNWNVVCNTGMVLGALAIEEHYPELAKHIIGEAVRYIPNCLKHFAPDGVCYEGPAYWGYTNMYLSLLLKALNDNFGGDFGLSEMVGVDKSVLYYMHSTSPSGKIFNFANSGSTAPAAEPIYFYFSRAFNQPEVATFYRDVLSKTVHEGNYFRFYFLSIPWYDTASSTADALPKLKVYEGINDIVVFNGNRNIPNSLYLIAKTGDPDMAHQQLDIGTFIVEMNGIRWTDDLGTDNYNLPGFWDYKPDGQRWTYFRNSNFSHNTLSIDHKLQNSAGTGEIDRLDDRAAQPFVTMNMSTAYAGQSRFVYRTFRMLDDTRILVTDSVGLQSPSQSVQWSVITSADVECKGNTAVLRKDGKSFSLKIASPTNASFTTKAAKRGTEAEKPIEGYTVLSASVSGEPVQVIKVLLSGE